jgi:hypothetical protein
MKRDLGSTDKIILFALTVIMITLLVTHIITG